MNKLALIAVAGIASAASADVFSGGSTGAIADNVPAGTSYTLNVAGSGTIVSMNSFDLDINHTWVGDLIITLEHNGTSVTLLDRPGVPQTGVGNGSDLAGVYSFQDGGAAWSEATGSQAGVTVAPGVWGLNNTDGTSLADFVGQDVNGTWTLTISDNAGLDLGTVNAWSFDATIPAPGAAALFGLGGLAAARRRR